MKVSCILFAFLLLFSVCRADTAAPQGPDEKTGSDGKTSIHEQTLAVRREVPKKPEPRPFIGISMEPVDTEEALKAGAPKDCVAIRITGINKDSAAEKAGLKTGDLIFGVEQDGKRILFISRDPKATPQSLFVGHVADKKPGDKLTVCVMRDGKEIVVPIVLGKRPVFRMQAVEHPEFASPRGEASLLERFLMENDLMKNYVATANMLYAASNMIQGPEYVVEDTPDYFRLKEITYLLRHPEHTAPLSERIADSIEAAFRKNRCDLPALIGAASGWLDERAVPVAKSGVNTHSNPRSLLRPWRKCVSLPVTNENYMDGIVAGFSEQASARPAPVKLAGNAKDIDALVKMIETAYRMRSEAFAKLGDNDRKAVEAMCKSIAGTQAEFEMLAALRAIAKIDFKKLYAACAYFAHAANQFGALQKCGEAFRGQSAGNIPGVTGEVLFFKHTKYGDIIVGGPGPNVYTADAAIVIDIGGDDVYLNNAGGTYGNVFFALCSDFGGDDIYRGTGILRQGAAMMGCGILIDTEGNDTYRADNFAQGFGLIGVGILADMAGNDTYRAKNNSQGAAWFGIGMLAEGGGIDSYHADNFAQGLALCKGFGAIIEAGGNDSYYLGGKHDDHRAPGRSYTSMGQGFGFGSRPYKTPFGTSGGIGLLADAEGHDRYVGDYFCQGASYWYALGILRDRKGNDHYFSGRYSQGAGIHLSLGALIDCAGDDSYIAYHGVSQGCGHDWAYGILEDRSGNDFYQAGCLSQGAGNDCGIGVLFDHKGNDRYVGERDVQGHGTFSPTRNEGSVGILMDLCGKDEYISPNGSADGKVFKKETQIGLFFDVKPTETDNRKNSGK